MKCLFNKQLFIEIPWPHHDCSQNSNKHWRKMHAARKQQKTETKKLCEILPQKLNADSVAVAIMFYPPDNRRRDADNMLSSIKAALDAISERIGIDDSKFWPITLNRSEKTDNARVEITLTI